MKRTLTLLLALMLLAACRPPSPPAPAPAPAATLVPTAEPAPTTAPPAAATPAPTPTAETAPFSLTVLYTNDEHGWMAGEEPGRGAAELVGLWQRQHNPGPNAHVLVLSGGDNWTGPAISTWFDGESMVEVMNAMGYAASVIGNHEFDFGLEKLRERTAQADFPYLSANLRYKNDGSVPTDLGIEPFALVDLGDFQVGLIGLTTPNTPQTTDPANIGAFDFIDPAAALREFVPALREAGADLILAPGHLCSPELRALVPVAAELGVHMLGGGHCNELLAREDDGVVTLIGGAHMRSYAWAEFSVMAGSGEVVEVSYGVAENVGGEADADVAAIVDKWQAQADASLSEPIGYLAQALPRRSEALEALIVESWLFGYPNADIALTNRGGIRADLPAGAVTLADVIGVLPFNNTLVEVKLTGAQLEQALAGKLDSTVAGGMHRQGGFWALDAGGERLDKDALYSVLVNSFMYAGGDDYTLFAFYDPDAYDTGIDWRQPVIDWIIEQRSDSTRPLVPGKP